MTSRKIRSILYEKAYNMPRTTGLVVFIVLILCTFYFTLLSLKVDKENAKKELNNTLRIIDQNIYKSLHNSELAAFSLALTLNDQGIPVNFEGVATEIIKTHGSVDALQLVPQGVIKYVYPYKQNKAALDYNILQDKTKSEEAFKAIEHKKMFFAGPFELRQGGMGIVGRLPVFIDNKFWGFSAVIIRLNNFIKDAGIDTSGSDIYHFQLSKINPETKKVEYFLANKEGISFENAASTFIKPGEWTLSVVATDDIRSCFGIFALGGLGILLSLISGLFVTSLLKKPAELEKLVVEQSKELVKSGQRNKAILQSLPDMLFIMDKDANFLFHQNSGETETFRPPEFFLGKNVSEVLPPFLAKEISSNIKYVIETGEDVKHDYHLEDQNGLGHFEARYVKINENEVLTVVRDISKIKKKEEEFLMMNLELRRLSEHLQNVREAERAALSRELHDELGQQLTAISLDLHWVKKMLPASDERIFQKISDALSIVQESTATVKRINTELRPSIIDDLGLFAAVEWLVRDFMKRNEIKTNFNCDCESLKISSSRSIAIFRMIQEALNNISKHAKASTLLLHCYEEDGNLKINISDDGIGFNEAEVSRNISFGLLGMKERANMLDGHIHIKTTPGKGTKIEICLPLEHLSEELSDHAKPIIVANI